MNTTDMSRIKASCGWAAAHALFALWLALESAGVAAGTPHIVLDLNAQLPPVSSNPFPLGKLGNARYFIASPAPSGSQSALYKTDGTTAGTTLVKSLGGYGVSGPAPWFLAAGAKAYFVSESNTTGQQVWITDGTAAGTQMITNLFPGAGNARLLGLIGTDLIFTAPTSPTDWEVFRTDGTDAGTRAITSFPASSYSTVIESLITPDGKIYMQLQTAGANASDTWVSDGNAGGAVQITGGTVLPNHLQANSFRQFGNNVL